MKDMKYHVMDVNNPVVTLVELIAHPVLHVGY